jgi:hypothetical protein
MSASVIALDKEFSSAVEEDLGKIGIRVVVFKKDKSQPPKPLEEQPIDLDEDEDFSQGDSEVNSYLELPKRGKLCCVFVINGQRHHGLDNTFIVNDLAMKYLRKRMIVMVDLDSLTPRATAEIIQGSRSGLFEGRVYHRIRELMASTLESDPDLLELQEEAEEELSQLQVGDAAVQEALDQLIQDHFEHGDHSAEGPGKSGGKRGLSIKSDGKKVHLDVVKRESEGDPATFPVLLSSHSSPSYRLRPGEKGKLFIGVEPIQEWEHVTDMVVVTEPSAPGFSYQLDRKNNHAVVDMQFIEPQAFDKDQYPLEVRLSVLATLKGQSEVRLTDKLVVIKPATYTPPPPPPQLADNPTSFRVASRQPVRSEVGKTTVHVRMRWDGKDELTSDPGAT